LEIRLKEFGAAQAHLLRIESFAKDYPFSFSGRTSFKEQRLKTNQIIAWT
jgi:hypothetical protein